VTLETFALETFVQYERGISGVFVFRCQLRLIGFNPVSERAMRESRTVMVCLTSSRFERTLSLLDPV